MAFLLGRGSAVEWLRLRRKAVKPEERVILPYDSLEGSRRQFERHAAEQLIPITKPVQLVVWQKGDRRRTAVTDTRVFNIQSGYYPAIGIKRMLFCSTPELAFVQMASVLDEERLRFLGMELCGRFGIDGEVFGRAQATTPEALAEQTRNLPGVHGRVKAFKVALLVKGGAASPMEIALALMLCTDRERGGYGLPWPELNHALPVSGAARQLWDGDHITPDLLWYDARLAIEYDSDSHHTGASRITRDAIRRTVLEELGVRVITVTNGQLLSARQTDGIARVVARHLGIPFELGEMDEQIERSSFQARMRFLGTHPEELLAIPSRVQEPKRSWHPCR